MTDHATSQPAAGLLEREDSLRALHGALAAARDGHGGIAVVSGEAGVGKTSLIRGFLAQAAGRPRVLFGSCDPLAAPRAFGPLIGAATAVDPERARRLAAGVGRAEAFAIALELVDATPGDRACVFVVEDAHWADEATLDLLTFLGRRIGDRRMVLIVSYRDDEVDPGHPLRIRLGELGTVRVRVTLTGLSLESVQLLTADSDVDPVELHRITAGNPFFVTEVLAGGEGAIPESVRDAVIARASRLDPAARAVLDAASIVPGRVERWLLDALVGEPLGDGLDGCLRRGLLVEDGDASIAFRHELARRAIEGGSHRPPSGHCTGRLPPRSVAGRTFPSITPVSPITPPRRATDRRSCATVRSPPGAPPPRVPTATPCVISRP